MKRNPKVRCTQCGAKNTEAQRCRICGGALPNAGPGTEDLPSFEDHVEAEGAAWRKHDQGAATPE
jgi:hypothetical protein